MNSERQPCPAVAAGQSESLVQLGHLQKSLDLAEALGFLQSQKKAQTLSLLQAAPWLEEAPPDGDGEDVLDEEKRRSENEKRIWR